MVSQEIDETLLESISRRDSSGRRYLSWRGLEIRFKDNLTPDNPEERGILFDFDYERAKREGEEWKAHYLDEGLFHRSMLRLENPPLDDNGYSKYSIEVMLTIAGTGENSTRKNIYFDLHPIEEDSVEMDRSHPCRTYYDYDGIDPRVITRKQEFILKPNHNDTNILYSALIIPHRGLYGENTYYAEEALFLIFDAHGEISTLFKLNELDGWKNASVSLSDREWYFGWVGGKRLIWFAITRLPYLGKVMLNGFYNPLGVFNYGFRQSFDIADYYGQDHESRSVYVHKDILGPLWYFQLDKYINVFGGDTLYGKTIFPNKSTQRSVTYEDSFHLPSFKDINEEDMGPMEQFIYLRSKKALRMKPQIMATQHGVALRKEMFGNQRILNRPSLLGFNLPIEAQNTENPTLLDLLNNTKIGNQKYFPTRAFVDTVNLLAWCTPIYGKDKYQDDFQYKMNGYMLFDPALVDDKFKLDNHGDTMLFPFCHPKVNPPDAPKDFTQRENVVNYPLPILLDKKHQYGIDPHDYVPIVLSDVGQEPKHLIQNTWKFEWCVPDVRLYHGGQDKFLPISEHLSPSEVYRDKNYLWDEFVTETQTEWVKRVLGAYDRLVVHIKPQTEGKKLKIVDRDPLTKTFYQSTKRQLKFLPVMFVRNEFPPKPIIASCHGVWDNYLDKPNGSTISKAFPATMALFTIAPKPPIYPHGIQHPEILNRRHHEVKSTEIYPSESSIDIIVDLEMDFTDVIEPPAVTNEPTIGGYVCSLFHIKTDNSTININIVKKMSILPILGQFGKSRTGGQLDEGQMASALQQGLAHWREKTSSGIFSLFTFEGTGNKVNFNINSEVYFQPRYRDNRGTDVKIPKGSTREEYPAVSFCHVIGDITTYDINIIGGDLIVGDDDNRPNQNANLRPYDTARELEVEIREANDNDRRGFTLNTTQQGYLKYRPRYITCATTTDLSITELGIDTDNVRYYDFMVYPDLTMTQSFGLFDKDRGLDFHNRAIPISISGNNNDGRVLMDPITNLPSYRVFTGDRDGRNVGNSTSHAHEINEIGYSLTAVPHGKALIEQFIHGRLVRPNTTSFIPERNNFYKNNRLYYWGDPYNHNYLGNYTLEPIEFKPTNSEYGHIEDRRIERVVFPEFIVGDGSIHPHAYGVNENVVIGSNGYGLMEKLRYFLFRSQSPRDRWIRAMPSEFSYRDWEGSEMQPRHNAVNSELESYSYCYFNPTEMSDYYDRLFREYNRREGVNKPYAVNHKANRKIPMNFIMYPHHRYRDFYEKLEVYGYQFIRPDLPEDDWKEMMNKWI